MKNRPSDFDPEKGIPETEEEEIDYDARNSKELLKSGYISKAVYDEIQVQLIRRREALSKEK